MSEPLPRVFCISMQRTGTTSVGKFLRDFGWRWAGWPADERNRWSIRWYEGDHEAIFASPDFLAACAFEDSPWFLPDFYKVLFHRFPGAKFVLFTRDANAWWRSMLAHSAGAVIGPARIHCKIYRRETEYFALRAAGSTDAELDRRMQIAGHGDHYRQVFRLHNAEVQDFFARHAPQALHVGALEDADKWVKLGAFLGVEVPPGYVSHVNASPHA